MTRMLVLPDSGAMFNPFSILKYLFLCPDKLMTTGYFRKSIFTESEFESKMHENFHIY